jgi:hypothetical protein
VIEARRRQRSFGDGLIAEEIEDLRENWMRHADVPAERIFEEVMHIRPQAWANLRILEIGDAMLGRRGELVAAAAGVYRAQLDRRQYLAEQMRSGGRGREIETAMR